MFCPKGTINSELVQVQVMVWRQIGDAIIWTNGGYLLTLMCVTPTHTLFNQYTFLHCGIF